MAEPVVDEEVQRRLTGDGFVNLVIAAVMTHARGGGLRAASLNVTEAQRAVRAAIDAVMATHSAGE